MLLNRRDRTETKRVDNVKLVLVGESGSGKDTAAKIFSDKLGIPIILSYTTRKIREGEGDTYRFVDETFYTECVAYKRIFEGTKFGDNHYWTVKEDFGIRDWIIIVDPIGVRNLKREFPDCKVIYVNSDLATRSERINDPDRIKRDEGNFIAFPCDFVLNNDKTLADLKYRIYWMVEYLWQLS